MPEEVSELRAPNQVLGQARLRSAPAGLHGARQHLVDS